MQGVGGGEGGEDDSELSGTICLVLLIRNHQGNGGGRIRSFPECVPYCF